MNQDTQSQIFSLATPFLLNAGNDPISEASLQAEVIGGSDWTAAYWDDRWAKYKNHMVSLEYIAGTTLANAITWMRAAPAPQIQAQWTVIFDRIALEDEKNSLQAAITDAQALVAEGSLTNVELLTAWQSLVAGASSDQVYIVHDTIVNALKDRDQVALLISQSSADITRWQSRIDAIDAQLSV